MVDKEDAADIISKGNLWKNIRDVFYDMRVFFLALGFSYFEIALFYSGESECVLKEIIVGILSIAGVVIAAIFSYRKSLSKIEYMLENICKNTDELPQNSSVMMEKVRCGNEDIKSNGKAIFTSRSKSETTHLEIIKKVDKLRAYMKKKESDRKSANEALTKDYQLISESIQNLESFREEFIWLNEQYQKEVVKNKDLELKIEKLMDQTPPTRGEMSHVPHEHNGPIR